MKILFINPPADHEITSCNPEIIKEERGHEPPLGLLYISGYLQQNSSYELGFVDAQAEELSYDQLKQRINQENADVVAMTIMTFTILDVIKTVKIIREISSNIKIVLGGPHAHIYPEKTINLEGIDYVVLGEGERTFFNLLDNLNNSEKLKQTEGLVFKENGKIINTGNTNYIKNLDELPFPARNLTPYKKYSSLLARKNPITTMFTSRGCPYQCSFCDRPNMGKGFRARSAKNVVDEMEECLNMGIKEIFIYDDTFTVQKQRVLDICNEIQRRNLKFSWDIRARVDTVDEEMIKKLKKAGCARIHYGVEAGTEKILKVLNKKINLEQVIKTFEITKKHGISTLAYFMVGCPTETREDILETINFAKKLEPDFVQITIFTPFPATKIYRQGLEDGFFEKDYWLEFAKNPKPGFETKYWEENLSLKELQELIIYGYKQFYTRPKYIIKKLFQIRSWDELKRKIKAGLKVITMKSI